MIGVRPIAYISIPQCSALDVVLVQETQQFITPPKKKKKCANVTGSMCTSLL